MILLLFLNFNLLELYYFDIIVISLAGGVIKSKQVNE